MMTTLKPSHPEKDLLLPYLDGELSTRQARRVRRHVEACWECRGELEELHALPPASGRGLARAAGVVERSLG